MTTDQCKDADQPIALTKSQARLFLLMKHGLIDIYKFKGKQGVLDYIDQAGCIQFDPIDICGKNAELVLQSRVSGFTKQTLYELLYSERKLVDYFDKNLAIFNINDWKYFERYRASYKTGVRNQPQIDGIRDVIRAVIKDKGAVSSADLDFNDSVSWYWNATTLSRAALEALYFRGDLIIHHKKGTRKFYDLAENHIPEDILNADDPNPDDFDFLKWQVLRRIGSVGLLWNKPSDAWLNIWNLKAGLRDSIFKQLIAEGKIIEVTVNDISASLYCNADDTELLKAAVHNSSLKERCELIAPP